MYSPDLKLENELFFKTSRSSGKGGQNVNKVSTKVELNFEVCQSQFLTDCQKEIIQKKLKSKINRNGNLQITVQSTRSQLQNKDLAIQKFHELISKCFEIQKKRIATKPNKSSREKRLKEKKRNSEKKSLRNTRH